MSGGTDTNCSNCLHHIPTDDFTDMCGHPNLDELLDDEGYHNTGTYCEAVRDLKSLCAHAARWFEPK